ncbi:MAG: chemotaxis protein CheW, partial [Coriobacteriia bacterium]
MAEKNATLAKTNKHLTFTLDGEEYGLDILKVQEIIGIMPITRVPRTPEFVRGVINLRGKVIPVVDLRTKFGMGAALDTDRTCIVVVQVSGKNGYTVMGTVVDEVSEVIDIAEDEIEETPEFGAD